MRVSCRTILGVFSLLWATLISQAQQPATPAGGANVIFKFHWDEGRPWTNYAITVAESGATHFSGTANVEDDGDGGVFDQDFAMTEANRQKVFDWAKATNYFQGRFEAKQKNIAKTGTKTLEYHGAAANSSLTYNYSPNPDIQQLTKLFQAIAVTLDFGRKLAYQYRFDKLGMDTRLKELTDMQTSGYAEELQAIAAILRKIADDPNMMHISRLEAKQLLKSAHIGTTAASRPTSQP